MLDGVVAPAGQALATRQVVRQHRILRVGLHRLARAVARSMSGPRVDAERADAQVVPDRLPGLAPVAELLDLADLGDGVAHRGSPTSVWIARSSRTGSKSESPRAKSRKPGYSSIARP